MSGIDPLPFDPEVLDARIADGTLRDAVSAALTRADEENWIGRLLEEGDAGLWGGAGDADAASLAWLNGIREFPERIGALEGFGEGIREAGFTTALVVGPDGGALPGEAVTGAFGTVDDWLTIRYLAASNAAAIAAAWDGLDPLATLVMIAPGDGPTREIETLVEDAWKRIGDALRAAGERRESPGEFMVAITDNVHGLGHLPRHDQYREVFVNPQPLAPPRSGISYAGLVPASLAGIDLDALESSWTGMSVRSHRVTPVENPAIVLGTVLGVAAAAGRTRLRIDADPALIGFGRWLSALLAGVGFIDEAGSGGSGGSGGAVQVVLRLDGAPSDPAPTADPSPDPVITIRLADPVDVAGEFVRFGIAVAIAGILLGRNPFLSRPDTLHP